MNPVEYGFLKKNKSVFPGMLYMNKVTETKINQGPMKGQMNKTTLSDYEEVDGLYFPFSMNMGGQTITIKNII